MMRSQLLLVVSSANCLQFWVMTFGSELPLEKSYDFEHNYDVDGENYNAILGDDELDWKFYGTDNGVFCAQIKSR